jgi:TonB family protein
MMISTNPAPRYPAELLASKDTGTVRIRVLVRESGRADMSTVQVIESPHAAFTRAVIRVLPDYQFIPAEVGGSLGGPCRMSGAVEVCALPKPGKKVSQPVDIAFVFAPPAEPPPAARDRWFSSLTQSGGFFFRGSSGFIQTAIAPHLFSSRNSNGRPISR